MEAAGEWSGPMTQNLGKYLHDSGSLFTASNVGVGLKNAIENGFSAEALSPAGGGKVGHVAPYFCILFYFDH